MNTLDMYTREKANKLHLAGLQHQAQSHHMLRNAWQDRHLEDTITKRRLPLTLTFTALGPLFGSLLTAFATRF